MPHIKLVRRGGLPYWAIYAQRGDELKAELTNGSVVYFGTPQGQPLALVPHINVARDNWRAITAK